MLLPKEKRIVSPVISLSLPAVLIKLKIFNVLLPWYLEKKTAAVIFFSIASLSICLPHREIHFESVRDRIRE